MSDEVSEHVFSILWPGWQHNVQGGQGLSGFVDVVRFIYGAVMFTLEPRLARILLVVAILAVYLPMLGGGFVWDDHLLVVGNQLTDSLANIPAMFQTDLWGATPVPDPKPGYYRPLMLVDLALTRAVGGLDPRLHHVHNLIWHGTAVVLLLMLLERITKDPIAATLGAAVFALHPVQIEVVGFVSARNDPMAVAWLLAALLLLSQKAPSRKALIGGALASAAAMLCKESVVFAPVLLAFASRARWGGWGTRGAHGAVVCGFGVALAMRMLAGVGTPAQADWSHLMAITGPASAFYLDKLISPIEISPVIHFGWLPPVPWINAGIALLLLTLLARFGGPLGRAGLAFAVLGLAPAFAAVAHVGAVVDRYMYLPMVGVAWAVTGVAGRPGARSGVLVALVGMVGLSIVQGPIRKDDASLWEAAIERAPSGYAKGAFARWLEDEGKDGAAAHWYREAIVQPPRPFHESCYNITRIHLKRGIPKQAIAVGEEALEAGCEPSAELVAPLALAYALTGDWAKALQRSAKVDTDPTGKAILARLASQAAMGDVQPLKEATSGPDGERLLAQVLLVLRRGGADVDGIQSALNGDEAD